MDDPVLHLSLPVAELAAARHFYEQVLGCRPGRQRAQWADVWFYGMQLTLRERPEEVRSAGEQGVRHFGVALSPADFDALATRLDEAGVAWLSGPIVHDDAELSGKRAGKLADPSGNVIEFKSYEHADVAEWLADGR